MIAAMVFWSSAGVVVWIYAGYPMLLGVLGRLRPRPRERTPVRVPISAIVAAHNEGSIIASKVENLRSSAYPEQLLEVIVVSDGSDDLTVERARNAGAHLVIDLPRVGKLRALNAAVDQSSGDVLVFTDADSELPPETLDELVSNFADPHVGGVAANEVHIANGHSGVGRGESLYWRYEQKLKALEDSIGSAVSASGRLFAMRRSLYTPSTHAAGADDVVLSTQVISAGRRLAFDGRARVLVASPSEGGTELVRKVRMMNQGLRAAFALMSRLSVVRHGPYMAQLMLHKVLRRFVGFFLLAVAAATVVGVSSQGGPWWWLAFVGQATFYALASAGAVLDRVDRAIPRPLWVPYYFCLSNLAAALAVLSLIGGKRFEMWEPTMDRGSVGTSEART
jgi:glycosyltransferase involved in cell wall biosynthesis